MTKRDALILAIYSAGYFLISYALIRQDTINPDYHRDIACALGFYAVIVGVVTMVYTEAKDSK